MSLLAKVIKKLATGQQLSAQHRDHRLLGEWQGYRECHLSGDWLLIYSTEKSLLTLARTGSHSELFA